LRFTKDEHKDKAEQNEQLAATFPVSVCGTEWAITAIFYAALHYVDAYFALQGRSYIGHASRNKQVSLDPALCVISDEYKNLYNLSRDARYEVMRLQPGHLTYALNQLDAIKKVICPLL
jgi:hypothetical protein